MSRWIREMENERKKRESMLRTITGESAPIPATSYQAYREQHGLVGGALRYWFRRNPSSPLAAYQDEHGLVNGTFLRGREYCGQKLKRKQKAPAESKGLLDLDLHDEDLDAYRSRVRGLVDSEVSTDAVAAAEALTQRLPENWTEGHLLTAYASIRLFDATSDNVYLNKARESIDRAWEKAGEAEREGISVHRDYIYERAASQSMLSGLDEFRLSVKQLVDSEVSPDAVEAAEELTRRLPDDWTEGHLLTAYAAVRLYDATSDLSYLTKAQQSIERAWARAMDEEKTGISVHREYIFGRRAELEDRDNPA